MSAKKTSAGKWIALVVALFCMFATGLIAPPAGLSQAGFQVLGILVGAIILFLSWGTGWPSMAIFFALMTVPRSERIPGHPGHLRQQHRRVPDVLHDARRMSHKERRRKAYRRLVPHKQSRP